MHVIGFCGYSGSGKTTLVEQLIARLRLAGLRVSVVKHAHHEFDIDHEGKDSWRHRQAGAFEVVIASNRRLAKIRELHDELLKQRQFQANRHLELMALDAEFVRMLERYRVCRSEDPTAIPPAPGAAPAAAPPPH